MYNAVPGAMLPFTGAALWAHPLIGFALLALSFALWRLIPREVE